MSNFINKLIIEVSSTKLLDSEKLFLSKYKPKSFMLRSRNFLKDASYQEWFTQYQNLINEIKEITEHDILSISIDHEGGLIVRPPSPITRFPYPAYWGNKLEEITQAMALELNSLGVNFVFAPVADIHSNDENPVINDRAFGRSAKSVTPRMLEVAELYKKNGITPCVKHFPGHGDTSSDSHYDLPVLDLSLEQLESRELLPFLAAIENGIPAIMTAHIIFPQIDSENITTYSKTLLNDLLRDKYNFKGLIIADAICMKPILETLNNDQSTVKAVNAGLDQFIVAGPNTDLVLAEKLIKYMEDAYKDNKLDKKIVDESFERIDQFYSRLSPNKLYQLDQEVFQGHQDLNQEVKENKIWIDEKFKGHMITR